ncbi:MAG: PP2C family protein-serine/threonine phosphatase [Bacteroidales bacterium]
MKIKYAVRSDIGQVRENNEDNNICLSFDAYPHILLLGAIDAVGGYEGGEIAAEICKLTVESYFEELTNLEDKDMDLELKKSMYKANNRIYSERSNNPEYSQMSCVATVVLMDIQKGSLCFTHVGDSRGYIYRDDKLEKFTTDHSLVGYLEESGRISEEDAMNHPRRNEISKLMGGELLGYDSKYMQCGRHSFYSGDIVVLCSDGLTDLVNAAGIVSILSADATLEDKKELLIYAANHLGGRDNITVALATSI